MEALTTLGDERRRGIQETLHQLAKDLAAPTGRQHCNIRDVPRYNTGKGETLLSLWIEPLVDTAPSIFLDPLSPTTS